MKRLLTLLLALATHPGLHCGPSLSPLDVQYILEELRQRDPGGDIVL